MQVESQDNDQNQKTNHSSIDEGSSFDSNSLNTTPLIRNSMRKIEADNSQNSHSDDANAIYQTGSSSKNNQCEVINHFGEAYHD